MLRKRLAKFLVMLLLFSQISIVTASADPVPEPAVAPEAQTEEPAVSEPDSGTENITASDIITEETAPVVQEAVTEEDNQDASVVVEAEDIDLEDPLVSEKYFVVRYTDGTTEIRKVQQPSARGIMSVSQAPEDIDAQIEVYEQKNDVEIAEPLIIRKATGSEATYVPNDTLYSDEDMWGIRAIEAERLYGWGYTSPLSGVVIAVIDTGMDMDHPDLAGSLASVNRGDGVMVSGYDAVANTSSTPIASMDYTPDDGHGHGTHTAGTAAAIVNNGVGVAGVAGGAKILPVKVLNDSGSGTGVDVAEGITWAVNHGADIISLSLGSASSSQVELDAVNYAYSNGVVIVAATGNDSNNWTSGPANLYDLGQPLSHVAVSYPAAYNHVIAVGSVGVHGGQTILSDFSNSGSYVDVVAPGESVLSTYKDAQYATMSGTSMATPHVAGLAALVLAEYPTYTPDQVEEVIEETANMVPTSIDATYGGNATYYGAGVVDAYAAIGGDVRLEDLVLDSEALSFNPLVTTQTVSVDYGVSSIGIKPVKNNSSQQATINGAAYVGSDFHTVSLNEGLNNITVVVTAKDTLTTGTYTIAITRLSPDATLASLSITPGNLSPSFGANTVAYSATVASADSTLNLIAVRNEPHATITVNGDAYSSGSTKEIGLGFGTNTITVVVDDHGVLKTYTLTVTRPYYTDKTLHSLALDGTGLPGFSPSAYTYSASVGTTVSGIEITVEADSYATIEINNVSCTSGVPFPVTLPAENNVFSIEVTAHNGDQQTYTLTITRGDFTNANLSMISVGGSDLNDFAAGTLNYYYDCESNVATPPAVAADKAVTEATVVIDQATNFTDDKVATLVVTAVDGSTQKTYSVEFNRYTVLDSGTQSVPLLGAVPTDVVLLEIPETVTDPEVTVTTSSAGGFITSTLPEITADRTLAGSTVAKVEIAGGTVVSAPAASNWDGTISLPTINETSSVSPGSGTVNRVVEMGFPGTTLTFSKAVRIQIPGMAGKSVGYVSGGAFHTITTALGSDTQAAGDALGAGGDGKISVGGDMVIWTKHFTEFVAYTVPEPAAQQPSGGGGGGGGGSSGAETVVKPNSEAFMETDAIKVAFVPGTYYSEFQADMNAVSYSVSPFKATQRLIGKVFIINKNIDEEIDKPMNITFTVNLKEARLDLDKERLALFYLVPKTNEWKELAGTKVDAEKGIVSGSSKLFTEYAVLAVLKEEPAPVAVPTVPVTNAPVSFTDMTGHWSAEKVDALVAKKAISGYPDGAFRPDAPITRAEFIAVLVKAQGITGYKELPFTDVEGHWAKEIIRIGYAEGIASGYTDGLFHPDDPITREQMAVMVDRTLRYASEVAPLTVNDQGEISPWALAAIKRMITFKVMSGYPDNTFRPRALATRAEAVTVILKTVTN